MFVWGTYGRTDGRFYHNQNFLNAQITKFYYPWCSAACAFELVRAPLPQYGY